MRDESCLNAILNMTGCVYKLNSGCKYTVDVFLSRLDLLD